MIEILWKRKARSVGWCSRSPHKTLGIFHLPHAKDFFSTNVKLLRSGIQCTCGIAFPLPAHLFFFSLLMCFRFLPNSWCAVDRNPLGREKRKERPLNPCKNPRCVVFPPAWRDDEQRPCCRLRSPPLSTDRPSAIALWFLTRTDNLSRRTAVICERKGWVECLIKKTGEKTCLCRCPWVQRATRATHKCITGARGAACKAKAASLVQTSWAVASPRVTSRRLPTGSTDSSRSTVDTVAGLWGSLNKRLLPPATSSTTRRWARRPTVGQPAARWQRGRRRIPRARGCRSPRVQGPGTGPEPPPPSIRHRAEVSTRVPTDCKRRSLLLTYHRWIEILGPY